MSPAPTLRHQTILSNLSIFLTAKTKGKNCKAFIAPVDVRLKGKPFRKKKLRDNEITTIVQPDFIIVCDPEKFADMRSIDGAPEMVIEILSPGNTRTENKYKLDLYEENGVLEYWVVRPEYKTVDVFLLQDDVYGKPTVYEAGDEIRCTVLKGIHVPVNEIFND